MNFPARRGRAGVEVEEVAGEEEEVGGVVEVGGEGRGRWEGRGEGREGRRQGRPWRVLKRSRLELLGI